MQDVNNATIHLIHVNKAQALDISLASENPLCYRSILIIALILQPVRVTNRSSGCVTVSSVSESVSYSDSSLDTLLPSSLLSSLQPWLAQGASAQRGYLQSTILGLLKPESGAQ